MAISRRAPAFRKTSASRPTEKPIVATNMPTATNDSAKPRLSAAGAKRCSLTAAASTMGMSGSTQGDSVDSTPARNAMNAAPIPAQMPLSRSASMDVASVSAVERSISLPPLKTMSVLRFGALSARIASFCVS